MKRLMILAALIVNQVGYTQNFINAPGQIQLQQRQASSPVLAMNIQTNRISSRNITNDNIQVQSFSPASQRNINETDFSENNSGNAFEQVLSFDVPELPQIQLGSGNMNLEMEVNLPKVNFKQIKLGSSISASSNSSQRKSFTLKKKFCKLSRNLDGRLHSKKIKFKVDKCFQW